MRTLSSLLSILLLAFGAIAFAQDEENQEAQEGDVVEIQMITDGANFYFEPAGVAVEPGTTIRWTLVSGTHDTTSYSADNDRPQRIPEGAEGWSSPILNEEGATFEVTLTEEGVYDYFCTPHEALGMVGRIVVGDAEAYPAQDEAQLNFPAAAEALPSVDAILADDDGRVTYEENQNASE